MMLDDIPKPDAPESPEECIPSAETHVRTSEHASLEALDAAAPVTERERQLEERLRAAEARAEQAELHAEAASRRYEEAERLRAFAAERTRRAEEQLRQLEDARARTEAELRSHNDLLYAIIRSAPLPIYTINAAGIVQTVWNPAAERVFGWSAAEALGRRLPFIDESSRDEFDRLRKRGIEGGFSGVEIRRRRRDGTPVDLSLSTAPLHDSSEEVIGMVAIAEDITQQKEAREQLRNSERHYRLLFTHNPLPMWIFDGQTFQFLDVNAAAISVYGWSREEFLSMTIADIRPPEDVHRLEEFVSHRDPTVIMGTQWRHLRKDGSIIDVEVYSSDLQVQGRAARMVLVLDISDRIRAEEQVRRMNDELEQRVLQRTAELEAANRELEAFSYSVSHDLRAPLRAIDGFARILTDEYGPRFDAEGLRLLGVISANAQKMGHLISDLLEFSRTARSLVSFGAVDMENLVTGVISALTEDAGVHVEFLLHPLPRALGDAALLRQVWVNLIDNAIKFSARSDHPVIEIGTIETDGCVEYFVRDNGIGFDPAYADNIYGVFHRLHPDPGFRGTGVGLAIVQRILVRHHGRIRSESTPGHGATFFFTLGPTFEESVR